ncbi:MAG TPA: PfkB family carbohydrate kinase [Microbacterium sp.]|uniref:PfkB family carbohydrate kinase n=1 Tax=Microbacterium sp. TaxID=51671 RepID=UPI002CF2C600|nr:PfkB family carbohydrate kinase [Microbacterium sp.]HWI30592.1 PfkB family carbohydrate kinase [Microbacterium sp.]
MRTSALLRDRLARIAKPSIVGVGDDVLDCYLNEDLAYPGGNALNVSVYSRLLFDGIAGFVGIVGDDRFAQHLLAVLDEVGVDHTRVRRAAGANGMAFVALDDDGDRRFVGSNRGGVQEGLRLRLTETDLDYLSGFGRVHTSVYSAIELELPLLRARGIHVSFDFSDDPPASILERVAPHVEVGFFSGGALSDAEVERLGRRAVDAGIDTAVVTLGIRGSAAFSNGARSDAGVVPVEGIDALGAGDAFIAGFLAATAAGSDLDECLEIAAVSGALACTYRGAFGYPVEAGADARAQLIRRYEAV